MKFISRPPAICNVDIQVLTLQVQLRSCPVEVWTLERSRRGLRHPPSTGRAIYCGRELHNCKNYPSAYSQKSRQCFRHLLVSKRILSRYWLEIPLQVDHLGRLFRRDCSAMEGRLRHLQTGVEPRWEIAPARLLVRPLVSL